MQKVELEGEAEEMLMVGDCKGALGWKVLLSREDFGEHDCEEIEIE